jgi:hypothetical protein
LKGKYFKYYIGLFALAVYSYSSVYGQSKEYLIQAADIEKFTNYIEWPNNNNNSNHDKTFKIAVVGDFQLFKEFEKAFVSRKLKNRRVEVVFSELTDSIPDIDILFLSNSRLKDLETANKICEKGVFLIITNSEGFAQYGAHINFYQTNEQTLHFEMNKEKLDTDGFKVDFLLLDFAKVVNK